MNSKLIFPLFFLPFISYYQSQQVIDKNESGFFIDVDKQLKNDVSFYISNDIQQKEILIRNINLLFKKLDFSHFSINNWFAVTQHKRNNSFIDNSKAQLQISIKHSEIFREKLKILRLQMLNFSEQLLINVMHTSLYAQNTDSKVDYFC